jgi:hypothetical protein
LVRLRRQHPSTHSGQDRHHQAVEAAGVDHAVVEELDPARLEGR